MDGCAKWVEIAICKLVTQHSEASFVATRRETKVAAEVRGCRFFCSFYPPARSRSSLLLSSLSRLAVPSKWELEISALVAHIEAVQLLSRPVFIFPTPPLVPLSLHTPLLLHFLPSPPPRHSYFHLFPFISSFTVSHPPTLLLFQKKNATVSRHAPN